MARMRRLAALAIFTLMGVPLQGGLAKEAGAPVAVGVRLSQDEEYGQAGIRPVTRGRRERFRLGLA